jgi:hypothetical protein
VAASLQCSDHFALMGDVPFPAMEKAFSLLKKLFVCGAVHGDSVAARTHARAVVHTSELVKHEAVARPAGGHFMDLQLEIDLW